MKNIIVSIIAILPILGVDIALRTVLAVTITMVAVAVWPFVPRFRRIRRSRHKRRYPVQDAVSDLRVSAGHDY